MCFHVLWETFQNSLEDPLDNPRKYQTNRLTEYTKKSHCRCKSYRLTGVSLVIFYEETKTFLQRKQPEKVYISTTLGILVLPIYKNTTAHCMIVASIHFLESPPINEIHKTSVQLLVVVFFSCCISAIARYNAIKGLIRDSESFIVAVIVQNLSLFYILSNSTYL